ncbi:MAG: hypothetical protein U0263_41715 [Polyangiaceae bacterium]
MLKVKPELIIAPLDGGARRDNSPEARTDAFLLALALAFNDLKFCVTLMGRIAERRSPEHSLAVEGELSGISAQAARYGCGILREILALIEERREVLAIPRFVEITGALPPAAARDWQVVTDLALSRSSLKRVLVKIRANAAFHYSQTAGLAAAYRHHFYEEPRTSINETAYIAVGKNWAETRFYFADAAATAAMMQAAKREGLDLDDFNQELTDALWSASSAIYALVAVWLRAKNGETFERPEAAPDESGG